MRGCSLCYSARMTERNRVAAPSAAINTIRAFSRMRCSVLVERAKPSSSARSSEVNVVG